VTELPNDKRPSFGEAFEKAVREDLKRIKQDPTTPPRVKKSLSDFKPPKI
jgi:hypothetical protein